MRAVDFDDLIWMLMEGTVEPNGTDMIVLLRASELAKGETASDWSSSPMIAEITNEFCCRDRASRARRKWTRA